MLGGAVDYMMFGDMIDYYRYISAATNRFSSKARAVYLPYTRRRSPDPSLSLMVAVMV